MLLLGHIYCFCLLTSSTTAINSNLHLLGSHYGLGAMLNILNVLFNPQQFHEVFFSYFIDGEPEA